MLKNRRSGVLAHITSLYTDYGIGDLGQASRDFIDFLAEGQQSIWQILPIGPTGYGDSPYQSFSTFAGNPLLICPIGLAKMGLLGLEDVVLDYNFPDRRVDYGPVIEQKGKILRRAFENFGKSNGSLSQEYKDFLDDANFWLRDYALFVALKAYFIEMRRDFPMDKTDYDRYAQKFGRYLSKNELADFYYGAVWLTWPEDVRNYDSGQLGAWRKKLAAEIDYQNFLQFIFFQQFGEMKKYAGKKGIEIMGDIPIFVALDSADCWAAPGLFQLGAGGVPKVVAGVPPDYFCEDGQLWGNPLYDWDAHAADGYSWWMARLKWGLRLTDILRIDHFIGFVRNYAINFGDANAKNGKWQKGPGADFFAAAQKTFGQNLPIIAEDLGMLTPAAAALRDKFALPGMKVLHFGFDSAEDNPNLPHSFASPNCVVYTGTHDNDTSRGWYENAAPAMQDYFRRYTNSSGDDAAWDMIRLAHLSTAHLSIIPIQDLLNQDTAHRMNRPGDPTGNWQYRLTKTDLIDTAPRLAYLTQLSHRQPPLSANKVTTDNHG
ncbi:MAG: 4-alpha-glucanotransferase [Defluviitaleaceae bacterium]|nr:4-alpha-glucanotransferase [Defluviitaleaceae bacterium]